MRHRLGVKIVKLAGVLYALGLMLLGVSPQAIAEMLKPSDPKPTTGMRPATPDEVEGLRSIYRLSMQHAQVH